MRNLGLSTLAALALVLSSCVGGSGNSAGSAGTPMYILTCSLGCPNGAGGQEVHCTPISIAPNQEFVVTFSQNVDPSSITSETFSIIDTASGSTPLGTRLVDPVDARRVIFRPAITFDSQGNPTFGFSSGTSYSIVIKGTAQDSSGPYIRSQGGTDNASRMSCQMQTTSTPIDYVPGAPSVQVLVDLANTATPNPNDIIADQPAAGAVDVWRSSTIRFVFDDIMNPVTLANQVTHQASYVSVKVDVDGNLNTTADQVVLSGIYVVTVDIANLRTLMTFTASGGMPSSGDPNIQPDPRKVLVTYPSGITDLAGHPLANAGSLSFVPELVELAPVILPDADGEDFVTTSLEQVDISSANWGNGRLDRGYGGGSGRLGTLVVNTGTVDLSTDSQTFPLDTSVFTAAEAVRDLLDNKVPGVDYTASNSSTWPTITVTDGVFEFSSLTIKPGGTLRFHGNHAARLLVRGPVQIQSSALIDVRGSSASVSRSDAAQGGTGATGGPNAGAGGDGADRFDNTGIASLIAAGAIANPGADLNGAPGGGVGQVAGLGAAPGGALFPSSNLPLSNSAPASLAGGLSWTFDQDHFPQYTGCICLQPGSPGGGGTYATAGTAGTPATPMALDELNNSNLPAVTQPGALIPIEPPDPESGHVVRKLDFYLGFLRGGSGGGGGGGSLFGTDTSVQIQGFPCGGSPNTIPNGLAANPGYQDNSGNGGGGGGGALQIASGGSILIDGVIDARGGNGAGTDSTAANARQRQSAPGGGGSGGAIHLQGLVVELAQVAGRLDVRGGSGGLTDMNHNAGATNVLNASGGNGGPGLVRIEDSTHTLTRATEAPWILPFDPTHIHSGSNLPESEDILSVGNWVLPRKRPESFSAATSCWLQPNVNFFLLQFLPDDLGNVDPDKRYGWNMDVVYNTGGGDVLIKYRGPDANLPFPSGDFQSNLGNTLNHGLPNGQGSYFAVRFQGAKSRSPVTGSPCNVNLFGVSSDIVPGSLTPWVQHPSDLNAFTPRPDMVRFCVVFDTALATPNSIPSFIKGVTNLKIRTQPD